MKIATKKAAGYGVLTALMLVVSAYQLVSANRFLAAIEGISGADYQSVTTALQLMSDRNEIDLRTRHYFLSGSAADAGKLKDALEAFEVTLGQIRPGRNSARQQTEIDRLHHFWNTYQANLAAAQRDRRDSPQVPEELEESLDQLRTQTETLYQLSKEAIDTGIEPSRRLIRQTRAVLLSVDALALALSALAVFLIIRSVSAPLNSLQQGTRALAEGKSFYRLDTSRNDELAHLAKDFNTLVQKLRELEEKTKPHA